MQDPRENPIFDLQFQHKYRFCKERTGGLIDELNNLAALLPELALPSCQNDQDFSGNIRSQSIDIEQIETNRTVLVRMQQYIPIIKDKMLTISILDDPSLSILDQFNDHITRLDATLTEYTNDVENYHVKFLKYTAIREAIKQLRSIAIHLLHDLRIKIKENLQKIFHDKVDFLPDSFLVASTHSFEGEESEEESIIVLPSPQNEIEEESIMSSPSTQQDSEESTSISSIESKGANQHSYDEHIFLDLPQEIQILLLSTMTCKDAKSFGMTASYYNNMMKDPLLWKVFFKRDFSYHYPALTVFEKYQTIDWQEEYKLAKKNPPWPFPLEINVETVSNTSANTLGDAIRNKQAESVISNLQKGITVQRHFFTHAFMGEFSPFILELLVEACKSDQEFLNYALHLACEQNNSMGVAILIKAGANVNCKIFNSELQDNLSPLHAAIQHGNLFLVKMLLDLDAVAYDSEKFTLLYFLLCNARNFDELKDLSIFDNQDVNKRYKNINRSVSLLEKTIIDQKFATIKMFEWLLDNGADPNTLVDSYNQTISIFHFLILKLSVYQMEMIKILLKYKPNLEARDTDGHTIIHSAIIRNQCFDNAEEIVVLLLDQNAELDVTNNNGETILHSFLRRHQDPQIYLVDFILRLLLNHIDVNSKDNQGVSPLNLAMNNALALTSMILMKLVPAEITDQNQENILHKFASMNLHDITSKDGDSNDEVMIRKRISLLVKSGVDPNKQDKEGDTPLQIAINKNNILVFQSLVANGAKIVKLKFMKHRSYPEIHCAINCYRYVEQAIAIVKNMNGFLFFSSKLLDRIENFVAEASGSDRNLCQQLISNYLFGDALSNSQKERLVDGLFVLMYYFSIDFWGNLSTLARDGGSIQLPPDKIIKILELYRELMEIHDRDYHSSSYQEKINQTKELIANYKKETGYVGQVNHNK